MSKTGKDFWGKSVWMTIHSQSVTYTPDKAEAFKSFISSLTKLLPCKDCQKHLKENLQKYPIDYYLDNNDNLFFWTYLLHDAVNKSVGKKSPKFDIVKKQYYDALQEECANCNL